MSRAVSFGLGGLCKIMDETRHYVVFLGGGGLPLSVDEGTNGFAGNWEDVVVSNVKKVIPDSVQQKWHERRVSKAKQGASGEHVSDSIEGAGWGVEEADERHKRDASACSSLYLQLEKDPSTDLILQL